ncbi:MAG: hypothetical protein ACE366_20685 [Bradymonadia bacterium]
MSMPDWMDDDLRLELEAEREAPGAPEGARSRVLAGVLVAVEGAAVATGATAIASSAKAAAAGGSATAGTATSFTAAATAAAPVAAKGFMAMWAPKFLAMGVLVGGGGIWMAQQDTTSTVTRDVVAPAPEGRPAPHVAAHTERARKLLAQTGAMADAIPTPSEDQLDELPIELEVPPPPASAPVMALPMNDQAAEAGLEEGAPSRAMKRRLRRLAAKASQSEKKASTKSDSSTDFKLVKTSRAKVGRGGEPVAEAPKPRKVFTPGRKGSEPTVAPAPVDPELLKAEARILTEARRALSQRRAPARALQLIQKAAQQFPNGQMRDLRAVLKVEALMALDRTSEARTQALMFMTRHHTSPFAGQVKRWLSGPLSEGSE